MKKSLLEMKTGTLLVLISLVVITMFSVIGFSGNANGSIIHTNAQNSANGAPAQAIDDNLATRWGSASSTASRWWSARFDSNITVINFSLTHHIDTDVNDITSVDLQGSTDNSTWVSLDNMTSGIASGGQYNRTISSPDAYEWYKVVIATIGNNRRKSIREIDFFVEDVAPPIKTIVIYQYINVSTYTNTTIVWDLIISVLNNRTDTLTNIVVDVDDNFTTTYTIGSLGAGAINVTHFTVNYTRGNVSIGETDITLNINASNITSGALGRSNPITSINPVDPPTKLPTTSCIYSGDGMWTIVHNCTIDGTVTNTCPYITNVSTGGSLIINNSGVLNASQVVLYPERPGIEFKILLANDGVIVVC